MAALGAARQCSAHGQIQTAIAIVQALALLVQPALRMKKVQATLCLRQGARFLGKPAPGALLQCLGLAAQLADHLAAIW